MEWMAYFWAFAGFLLAAYAIVANDAIQTLGTFLSSNARRSWVVLWAFASTIIISVMVIGYFDLDRFFSLNFIGSLFGLTEYAAPAAQIGDIGYERLDRIPYPEGGVQWYHAVPPLILLILTRFGIPVSTTFLVLTVFVLTGGAATEGKLYEMLVKSGLGYLVAFGAGAVVYLIVSRFFERWVSNTKDKPHHPVWFVLQWASTAFLWSQWLMQDLANIFVFLPRETTVAADAEIVTSFSIGLLVFATLVMVGLHAIIFATRGGEIQKIVLSKTNTTDIRAATLVDFIYGLVLLYFKELNDIPMSTTWVFLGLLAGRETMISLVGQLRPVGAMAFDLLTDAFRAFIGLVISVVLAIFVPTIAKGELGATVGNLPSVVVQALSPASSDDDGAPESGSAMDAAPESEAPAELDPDAETEDQAEDAAGGETVVPDDAS
jgi:hypothetical protein